MRDVLRCTSPLVLVGLFLSCAPRQPAPEVEYWGCREVVLPGPVCFLSQSTPLTLWVAPADEGDVEIQADGQPVASLREESGGGWRYRLDLPVDVSTVTVHVRYPDGKEGARWSLSLARRQEPAWITEARTLSGSGRSSDIPPLLQRMRKVAPPEEQGSVLRMLALLARGASKGEMYESYLEEAIAADRAAGYLNGEVEKRAQLAGFYLERGRFSDARQMLEVRSPRQAQADSKYLMAYYKGLLADKVGDYRAALDELTKAAAIADRIGNLEWRWDAEQVLARVYQDLGRSGDATVFAKLQGDPHPATECGMGTLLTNWAWSRLVAIEGEEQTEDPLPALLKAQAIFDGNDCARSEQRVNARLNLALAYLQTNRWREARRLLDQTSLTDLADLSLLLWRQDLEGRLEIAEGRPEQALRIYGKLAERAENSSSFENRFRASLGRARACLALGRRAEALAALAQADHIIDRQIWRIPVHEGRDTFLGQRESATRLHLKLLIEDGQRESAFALARRARARLLYQLRVKDRLAQLSDPEQKHWDQALSKYLVLRERIDSQAATDWNIPGDQKKRAQERRLAELAQAQNEIDHAVAGLGDLGGIEQASLSPPQSGEVVLIYHPLHQGWVGFAAHRGGIEVRTFELPGVDLNDPVALALQGKRLLEPFRAVIEASERVRVLPYGPLWSIDFHAVSLGSQLLLAKHSVIYSLDLPAISAPLPPTRGVALLVSDPEGNLPGAREEAEVTAGAIGHTWGTSWTLERLNGAQAGAREVREKLLGADFFHYAGHGVFGGPHGWNSELKLADDSRLTLGDLLSLPRAPSWVVLSACEGGRSSEQAPGSGIGLAQAFLLAGAQGVVAPTRRVPDPTARGLFSELYGSWRPGMDLPFHLRQAQLAYHQRHSADTDWASFRLLTR